MVISSETSHSALPLHKKGRIPVPHASGMRSGSAKKVKPIKEAIKKPIEKLKDTKAGEKAFKALKKIKASKYYLIESKYTLILDLPGSRNAPV